MADAAQLTDPLKEALLFLATAGVVVPVFRRLRVSPVLGFILAGVALGPHGLGRFVGALPWLAPVALTNVDDLSHLAEFGVVFLLFMIGLELSFERLTRMKRLVFGLGAAQVGASALAIAVLAVALGVAPGAAAVLGGALALSSTAIVVPVLAETRRLASSAGRAAFSILLFQDLMVAPLLVMVSMLGRQSDLPLGLGLLAALGPALVGLALLVGLGRLVLRPLFHHVALAGSTEFFMAACLLVVLATGLIAQASGLSMALGAFVAGLLLAETEYRREIEVTIEPFKGLLLGVFFVSVGASLDIGVIFASPGRTLGLAAGLVAVKAALLWGLARLFGLAPRPAAELALLLGPGGEFAFVMLGAAQAANVLEPGLARDVPIAVTLSMLAIPALAWASRRRVRPTPAEVPTPEVVPPDDGTARVVVVGYGRVGQLVGDMLARHDVPFVAVDGDAKLVARERERGVRIYWGDATRPEFLRALGLARARALVVTLNAPRAVEAVVRLARAERGDLTLVARARDAQQATLLYELGATDAVPETVEASLQLSEALLVDIGVPMGLVIASIHAKRDEFRVLLQPSGEASRERRAIKVSTRRRGLARRRAGEPPAA